MDVLLLDFFNNSVVTLTKMHGIFPFKNYFKYIFAQIQFFLTMSKEIYPDLCVCITRII